MNRRILFFASMILIVVSCSNEQKAFKAAKETGTYEAYEKFVNDFSGSELAARAKLKMDSLSTLSGGCSVEFGELTAEEQQKIEALEKLIGKKKDMYLLSELYLFLAADSTLADRARPFIQKILVSVANKHEISMEKKYLDNSTKLTDFYTFDEKKYPKFSYEGAVCRELQLMLGRAHLDIIMDNMLSGIGVYDFGSLMDAGMKQAEVIKTMNSAIVSRTIRDLSERKLDVCGKMRYWEFARRLQSGGAYFTEGIELDADIGKSLRPVFEAEKHRLVRAVADSVLGRFKS